jgi:hypothetical protein
MRGMPALSPENRERRDEKIRSLRVKLCDRAEYLHHLYRVNENLTTDDGDISEHMETWERLVDEIVRELASVFALERLDQNR